MTTSLVAGRVVSRDHIIEIIASKSKCPSCGFKMNMSIFINLDSDRPLQVSWVCPSCSHSGRSVSKHDLSLEVHGASRNERLANILYIADALSDSRSCSKNQLNALNDLFRIVAAEGIHLSYLDLVSTGTVLGMYFSHDGAPYIVLDEGLKTNPTEHLAVLAEEVGRHFAASMNRDDEVGKEVIGLRWAVKFLSSIPSDIRDRAC